MKKGFALAVFTVLTIFLCSISFGQAQDSYTLLIYLNGSDLESAYDPTTQSYSGNATLDLIEMADGLTSNETINVIIQTGGTSVWDNNLVDSSKTQRFELVDGAFWEVDSLSSQNMGHKKTLSDFIVWGTKKYPAKRTALILWNHGAGPVGGYGVDELHNFDSLELLELEQALETAQSISGVHLDLIGFDACLMASLEVADTISPYADVLVASEELEPGHGWNYTQILSSLSMSPEMDTLTLGQTIADSYLLHSIENNTADDVTLSVIDLSKIPAVVNAFEALIIDAEPQLEDNAFFYTFSRSIIDARSFGGNTESQGFTDLVDINSLANNLSTSQPMLSATLQTAVQSAVVYKVDGDYSYDTSGLSVYFPYRDRDNYYSNMITYTATGFSPVYQDFLKTFKQTVEENLQNDSIDYQLVYPSDQSDYYQLALSDDDMERVYYVYLDLYTEPLIELDPKWDMQYLGYDFLVQYDENTHSYFDNFHSSWTYLDSEPLMTYVVNDYDTFVEYESPVMYNGERMNLLFAWVIDTLPDGTTDGHYEVDGLRRPIDEETGMPDKNLYLIESGSIIEPLYIVFDLDEQVAGEVTGNPIYVSSESTLTFSEVPSYNYIAQFRLLDFSYSEYLTEFFPIEFPQE